jgi:hypothetical protein
MRMKYEVFSDVKNALRVGILGVAETEYEKIPIKDRGSLLFAHYSNGHFDIEVCID